PLVLPDPGVEHARGRGLLVQAVPLRRERGELRRRGEKLHRDVAARVRRPHRQGTKDGIRVDRHAPLHRRGGWKKCKGATMRQGAGAAVLTEPCRCCVPAGIYPAKLSPTSSGGQWASRTCRASVWTSVARRSRRSSSRMAA